MNSILITGTSSGLGKALAEKFEAESWSVFRHAGRKQGDLSFSGYVSHLALSAIDVDVDVVINNAAIVCPNIPLHEYSDSHLEEMVYVNLIAPMLLSKNLYNHIKNKSGLIVNINSMVGLEYKKRRAVYAATKWGLRAFSESLKLDNDINILDVYLSNVATTPDRKNALPLYQTVDNIFNSIQNKHTRLILDGRPNGGKTVCKKEF